MVHFRFGHIRRTCSQKEINAVQSFYGSLWHRVELRRYSAHNCLGEFCILYIMSTIE